MNPETPPETVYVTALKKFKRGSIEVLELHSYDRHWGTTKADIIAAADAVGERAWATIHHHVKPGRYPDPLLDSVRPATPAEMPAETRTPAATGPPSPDRVSHPVSRELAIEQKLRQLEDRGNTRVALEVATSLLPHVRYSDGRALERIFVELVAALMRVLRSEASVDSLAELAEVLGEPYHEVLAYLTTGPLADVPADLTPAMGLDDDEDCGAPYHYEEAVTG